MIKVCNLQGVEHDTLISIQFVARSCFYENFAWKISDKVTSANFFLIHFFAFRCKTNTSGKNWALASGCYGSNQVQRFFKHHRKCFLIAQKLVSRWYKLLPRIPWYIFWWVFFVNKKMNKNICENNLRWFRISWNSTFVYCCLLKTWLLPGFCHI